MSSDNPGAMGTRIDLESHDLHCEHCWQSYHIGDKRKLAEEYFRKNIRIECEDCHQPIDWWAATLKSIRKSETSTAEEICLPIGARRSVLETTLRANQVTEIVFANTGIPADAVILSVHSNMVYRQADVKASLQAVEIYQNSVTRRIDPRGAKFYGRPLGEPPHSDAGLHIAVVWVPNRPNDISWEYLANAFVYYLDDRYHGALLAANAAVEISLGNILRGVFEAHASKKNVDSFMQDAATYSHQLNVLLPTFASAAEAPLLPIHIRGSLNRLRGFRNKLAHGDIATQSIGCNDAAEALCAAVFGVRYLEVLEPYFQDPAYNPGEDEIW